MRLSRRSEPFDSDEFIYELKIAGFRSLAYIENGQCDLVSRNRNTFRNFKDLAQWIGENLFGLLRPRQFFAGKCAFWPQAYRGTNEPFPGRKGRSTLQIL